jgi:hypothetical protein
MQSNDIDIALTDMMGEDFAGHLDAFAKSKDVKTGPIAIFNPNPEQSKHLQTARIPIFGLELDLVNLRSEEYANNSRIPTAIVTLVLLRLSNGSSLVSRLLVLHCKMRCEEISRLTHYFTISIIVR